MSVPAIWREWFSQENKRTDYDSRRTWDSGLDAGSTPARSINFIRRNPLKVGRILMKHTDACERSSPLNAFALLKLNKSNSVYDIIIYGNICYLVYRWK